MTVSVIRRHGQPHLESGKGVTVRKFLEEPDGSTFVNERRITGLVEFVQEIYYGKGSFVVEQLALNLDCNLLAHLLNLGHHVIIKPLILV